MGGKKGGGSRSPRIDKNTLNSAQKLKVVDLISSGEIAGFINGNEHPLKSVYLNDTPVQNEDGSMNHAGVQFEFNNGAIDQDYLPSLSSIDNSVSVGVEVEKKNPITRTVTNQQVTSVRVTVGVDALMRSTKEGDQLATSVDMSIQIIKNGNIYASEHMHLNEKGNQPFRLDYVFSNLPTAPFDIRCVRMTEDSNDDMLRNKTYFFSYVESIDIKVRMPGSAVAMLQIDSQQFGSNNPTRNYGLKGCIVQVPSNYDPVNRTYTGLWDRLFKPAFTNNPAWVLYDILTADECFGEKFKDYRIDIDKLYELSKYCDGLVDDGDGGKEPRFVCNIVLFGAEASTVLDNICSIFRGTYSSANNHFTVQFDQKSDPVAVYNNSSVENGEFNYSYVPVTELFNQIKVEYIDKYDGYRTKIDEVSDESNIAKYGLRSTSITAFGATKRSYALRCAKWNLVTALTENETVTFVVGAAGIRHEQHDIIKIADNDYAGAQIGGRIESVNGNTITVDRELQNVKEFMVNVDGSVQTFQVIKAIDTKTYQLDAEVNAVDYVQFVATLNNLEPRLFRCIHIEEDSEINKYTITAIKHNPQKEGIVDKGAEYIEGNHSVLNTLPHLSNGIVGTEGRAIVLRWDSLETTGSENTYVVKLYNGLDFVRRDETKETFIKYENLKSGNYTARIRAVNENGQFSEELVITFSTTYEIDGLRAASIVFGIRLNWDVPELITTDAHTEIWYSKENDRELATKLAKLPYPQNTYTLNGLSVGEEYYFWFRLVDIDGNQGEFTRALKGQASQDADDILGYLDGKITETQISKDLQDQFNKNIDDAIEVATDDIKESIVSIDVNISDIEESLATIDVSISDINNDLQTIDSSIETLNAEDMFANIALKIEGEARFTQDSVLSASTANNSASIKQLDAVVADEFRAISQRETVLNAKIQSNEASIGRVSQSVVDNEKAQSIVNSENNAKFNDSDAKTGLSSIALATENNARAQNDSKISANVGLNNASIERIDAVIVDNEKAQANVNSTIQSQVNSNTSSIETAQSTIATDKQIQAQINSKLESEIGDNKSSIENLNQSFVDEKQSQVVINQKNNAKFNENSALTEFSTIALATENQVRAQNDSKISANVGLNNAEIKRVDDIVVTNEKSQASINTSLQSQVDSNKSSINNIHSTIVTDKEAQAQINNSLSTKIGDNESNINSLNQSFVDEKQSQSVINQKSSAKFNENEAVSDLSSIALATENNARAQNDSKLSANVGANSADIKRIDTVIVDNEKSVAQSIESLESKVGSNESSIKAINATIVADKTAQSQVNTKQQSQIDGNTSSINLLNKTIVSDKEAQAQINSGLSSQIGENTASITTIQTTTANIDGKVSSLYTMKVDANGNIAGMMIGADEYSSMVKFSADKFVVSTADQEINMFSLQTVNGKQVAQFNVDDLIAKGSISGDRFIAGSSIEAPIIKGGRVESGHFAGGSINIGNGNFNVDSRGNLYAKNGVFEGAVYAEKIEGDVVNSILMNVNSNGVGEINIEPMNFDRVAVFTNAFSKTHSNSNTTFNTERYRAVVSLNGLVITNITVDALSWESGIMKHTITPSENVSPKPIHIPANSPAKISIACFYRSNVSQEISRNIFNTNQLAVFISRSR